jgi:hypothetical protein
MIPLCARQNKYLGMVGAAFGSAEPFGCELRVQRLVAGQPRLSHGRAGDDPTKDNPLRSCGETCFFIFIAALVKPQTKEVSHVYFIHTHEHRQNGSQKQACTLRNL